MERRQIVITAGAALAAFAVAFGIGKLAGGGGEEPAAVAPGEPAAAFDVPTAAITADVESESLPSLKPKPTPEPEQPEPSTAAAGPSTSTASPAPAPATAAPAPEPEPGPVTGGGED